MMDDFVWIKAWGPGIVFAVLMLYGLYKLLYKISTEVGLKIVGALEKPAEALSKQANSMDRLTNSIQDYVCKDQTEHKEMMILLKVISQRVEHIREAEDGA